MNKQQEILLKMLKEIHEICAKNDIRYYVSNGTLIGAVRHGGFLPWDDDADVLMTYDQWERFKEVCKAQLPQNRYLGSADIDETYGHLIPRYIARDTTAIHTCQSLHDCVSGEVIDIFVLDPVADGEENYQAYLQDLYLYSAIANYANAAGYRVELPPERYRKYMDMVHEHGQVYVMKILEEKLASHFSDDGSYYVMRWQGVPVRYKRRWLAQAVPVQFEDTTLMAPVDINAMLTGYFGEDWSEIPTNITPTKHNTASSLDFPYTEALEYYRPTLDRQQLKADMELYRELVFKAAPDSNRLRDDRGQAKARLVAERTMRHVENNRALFEKALADRDGKTLAFILNEYLSVQTSKEMIGRHFNSRAYRLLNPIVLDVPEEVFSAGLFALICTDRLRFVRRLADIWVKAGKTLTPEMQRSLDTVELYHKSVTDYQFNAADLGVADARTLHDAYPQCKMFAKLVCVTLEKRGGLDGTDAERAEFEEFAQSCEQRWPDDGFFIKLRGDIEDAHGKAQDARHTYLQAAEHTRNGFALLDIARKTGYHPTWIRKSSWGKAYGIPAWSGEEPEPLERHAAPAGVPDGFKADPCQTYLLKLLHELVELCEANDIPYVLAPVTCQALFVDGWYPAEMKNYRLYSTSAGIRKLAKVATAANRILKVEEGTAHVPIARYYGTDSLLLSWNSDGPKATSCLYVSIKTFAAPKKSASQVKMAARKKRFEKRMDKGKKLGVLDKVKYTIAREEAARLTIKENDAAFKAAGAAAEQRTFGGYSFPAPADLASYCAKVDPQGIAASLSVSPSTWCSDTLGYAAAIEAGFVPADYFSRKRQGEQGQTQAGEISERFKLNYSQIKLAVQLKIAARELLPQKEQIMDLYMKGSYEKLADMLAGYIACVKKFGEVGDVVFDKDIYKAAVATRKWMKKHA